MQLSDAEKKIVVRLQKQQQSFIRWRWGILLSSIVSIGCGIYCMLIVRQCFRPDFASITILAIGAPIAYGMFVIGVWLMIYTFMNWNGKPEVRLLLRLIEESQDDA
jgi:hypothetical protein